MWTTHNDFLPVRMVWKAEGRVTSQWMSLMNTAFVQVMKLKLNSGKSCWQYTPLICDKNGTLSLWSSSQKPSLIMKEISAKSQSKYTLQNIWPLFKIIIKKKKRKEKKSETLSQPRTVERDRTSTSKSYPGYVLGKILEQKGKIKTN